MAQPLVLYLDDNLGGDERGGWDPLGSRLAARFAGSGLTQDIEELRGEQRSDTLDTLSAWFEGVLERMQSPMARKGMGAAFNATPEAPGRAAARTAKQRRC